MRITNRMMINSSMANIQINKQQLNTLDAQLSTQKKINKPSEDPIVAIRALRLRSNLNEVSLYLKKNIPDAQQWIETTQGAIDQAGSVIDELYKYCTQGSTDTYSSEQRETIIDSLTALKQSFYDEGNVDYAGRSIFTGYNTDTTLTYELTTDAEAADYTITQDFGREDLSIKTVYTNAYSNDDILNLNVTYDASNNQPITPDVDDVYRLRLAYTEINDTNVTMSYDNMDITIADDGTVSAVAYKVDASGAFELDEDGNKILADDQPVVSTDEEGNQIVTNAGKATTITKTTDSNYIPGDNEIALNASVGELVIGEGVYDDIYSSDTFSITYQKNNFIKGDLNPTMYFTCIDNNTGIEYVKAEEAIEYNINYAQKIKINTEADEVFDINLGRDIDDLVTAVQNVLDVETQISKVETMMEQAKYSDEDSQSKLNSMLEGLNKQKDMADAQMTKAFEKGISQMQGYQQTVSLANADVGNRLKRLELSESRLTEQYNNATENKSKNEDIDLEEVVINYTSAELVYNAALQAASKVVQSTLLDFIS
jgi:flagellar hook-associated protein 3 FlgL